MVRFRIERGEKQREPARGAGEYVVIGGTFGTFHASRAEGARVARLLGRWWPPRWIGFEDTSGSIVRVRSRDVNEMYDLGPGIRHAVRAIRRAHVREDAEDRCTWDDEHD